MRNQYDKKRTKKRCFSSFVFIFAKKSLNNVRFMILYNMCEQGNEVIYEKDIYHTTSNCDDIVC